MLNVRDKDDLTRATIFVPDGKLDHFEGLVSDYLAEKQDSLGRPRDNQRLLDAIREIRAASLRALWTDNEAFPDTDEGPFWWEVWLPVRRDRQAVLTSFRRLAQAQEMETAQGELIFPERTVLLVRSSVEQMQRSIDLWPETVRALIVHSAEWTDAMKHMFLPSNGSPSKSDYRNLLRRCGFGAPDLGLALWSVSNSLTMVVQETLHPFKKEPNKPPTTRDMHLHGLPWPKDVLEGLGETQVEMRDFIEPNPSQRDIGSRYRYQSHGLRFDVKRPAEAIDAFRSRINAAAWDEGEGTSKGSGDSAWLIGLKNRHMGSLHGDIWRGSAADLASRGHIGVYPALGWWRTRPALGRYDRAVRYALVVSIRAPEIDVDLYNEVANLIGVPVPVET